VLCALPNRVVAECAATSDTTMQLGKLASATVTSCAKATTRQRPFDPPSGHSVGCQAPLTK
jgi:hypothetical protein